MITRRPVKSKATARNGGGELSKLVEGLGYRLRAAAPGRCTVLTGDGVAVLDNVTASEIWEWLRAGGRSAGGADGPAERRARPQKIGGWNRPMLAVLHVAYEEGSKDGAHFGSTKDKAALRDLVKRGLAREVSRVPGGPEGVEIYALPTAAGVKAYETGFYPAKPSPKKKPSKKGNPSKKKKATRKKKKDAKKRKPAKKKKPAKKRKGAKKKKGSKR